jgi:branched-chain amino acid transport system permease protein
LYIIFIAIFLAFPFSLFKYTKYILFLVNMTAIGVIRALGLNILTGYTGLISLRQAAFMGVEPIPWPFSVQRWAFRSGLIYRLPE